MHSDDDQFTQNLS